jgi:hypothetical protein
MRTRSPLRTLLAVVALAGAALLPGTPGALAQSDGEPHTVNVEIILDSSGSMRQTIGGESRMQIAKRVLKQVVAAIPDREGINVGFRIYGHLGDNTEAGRAESCRSSELVVPIEGVDTIALYDAIDLARPTGWTPLAYSLGRAGQDLPFADPGVKNAIVLLTDGLETCGGDPCAVSGALNSSSMAITTHVVGFALTEREQSTVACIADEGGGLLLSAQSADELSGALFTILEDVGVVNLTGFLELESVDGVWPEATAVCEGLVTDSNPDGDPVTVRFDRSNVQEVPVGRCDVAWTEQSGDVSRVRATIASDRLTRIRGGLLAFPQGAGERYVVRASGGRVRMWDGPIEAGDRVWVRSGRYVVDLDPKVGDPILAWGEVAISAGTVATIHAGTEP